MKVVYPLNQINQKPYVKGNILPRDFYLHTDVVSVAKGLLGKYLCTAFDGKLTSGMIVEAEAYRAPDDRASHAFGNRRTQRTEPMFGTGGTMYIYLCYGIHHLFNVVSAPEGKAHAILVRALQPVDGIELMLRRRKLDDVRRRLCGGPGALSQALGLHASMSGNDLVQGTLPVWIEDRGHAVGRKQITSSPRVGVDYAGECAAWPWRFRIVDSEWTSPAK